MKRDSIKQIILNIILLGVLLISIFPAIGVNAQTTNEYVLLAQLPCVGGGDCKNVDEKTTLEKYLPGMFKLLIGLSAVAAVLNIVIGGFQYMSSDAIQSKGAGRERVKNSIYGLILVIGAWIILNEINPKLLSLNLSINSVKVDAPAGGTLSPVNDISTFSGRVRQSCPGCEIIESATYRLSEANIARFNCQTCTPMANGIPIQRDGATNSNVVPDLSTRLVALNNELTQQGVGWVVTEAFPPTVNHVDGCHYNGSCVDAGISNATPANIKRFIETARNNGLRAEYEVKTEAERTTLIAGLRASGMTGDLTRAVIVVPTINGAHFSVYNR